MPGGKTHDAITFLLAIPAYAAVYAWSHSFMSAAVAGAAFVFGGLMFGPDLDTVSRQYSRWLILRFIWVPYRHFFKHRSRFSHGLIFGAFIRVIYFMGVATIAGFVVLLIWAVISGGREPGVSTFAVAWGSIGRFVRGNLGESFFVLTFLGLWFGAASHTFTDLAGSFIKTGRIAKFL